MEMLLLFGILALNIAVSWWNCFAVGSSWDYVKQNGGVMQKLLLWSGAIQAAIGFSMPILLALAFTSISLLTAGEPPTLSPAEAAQMFEAIVSLWYLAIILPALGTGTIIMVESVKTAIERRDIGSIGRAAYNTFANIHNISGAFSGIGQAFGSVTKAFSGKGKGGKDSGKILIVLIAIMIVVVALLAGTFITASLIKRYRQKTAFASSQATAA
jgi:hypothetical protein